MVIIIYNMVALRKLLSIFFSDVLIVNIGLKA